MQQHVNMRAKARPACGCEIEHSKEEEKPNFIKGMRFVEQIIDRLLPLWTQEFADCLHTSKL